MVGGCGGRSTIKDLGFPWREIPENEEPGGGSAAPGDSSRSMFIEVLFDDEQLAIETICGYSRVIGTGATRLLSRIIPQSHPRKPWLRAIRADSVKGRVPLFQQHDVPGGAVLGADALGDAYYRVAQDDAGADLPYGPFMPYKFSRLSIDFRTLDLGQILDDGTLVSAFGGTDINGRPCPPLSPANVSPVTVRREYLRYVRKSQEHSVETIQLPQGKFKYYDPRHPEWQPPEVNPDNPVPRVTPVIRQPVVSLLWEWYDVPEMYLFDQYGIAANILAGDECVNEFEFCGFAPGTLLSLQPRVEPMTSIAGPDSIGLGTNLAITPRVYKVSLRLKLFDPPVPPPLPDGTPYPYRGHNLVPAPGGSDTYYLLTSNRERTRADGPGDRLYRNYDFEKLFQPPATQPPTPLG